MSASSLERAQGEPDGHMTSMQQPSFELYACWEQREKARLGDPKVLWVSAYIQMHRLGALRTMAA